MAMEWHVLHMLHARLLLSRWTQSIASCWMSVQEHVPASGMFRVHCQAYEKVPDLDGDAFTWWQQFPHLKNERVLQNLRKRQLSGQIRPDAMAILLFEDGYRDDMRSYEGLQNLAEWHEVIEFDEAAQCRRIYGAHRRWLINRAKGRFHVIGVRVANVTVVESA